VNHLASHLGDEVEASRDDDEVFIGGSFARVRERGRSARVLVRNAAVAAQRRGDL
jgi:hypothetical protein